MKYILSIAWRTFEVLSLEKIISILNKNNLDDIDGIEIASTNYIEMKMILDFCKRNKMIFQCHTPNLKDKNLIFGYLEDINKLSKIYGENINVVLHSLEDDDFEKSIQDTIEYVKSILDFIRSNELNIRISLENLNYHHNRNRINLSRIDEILCKFEDLKFTYDIGHDIFDNRENSKLSILQKEKINNIHLHNVYNSKDHETVFKNIKNVEYLKNAMNNLKNINYIGSVVVEVGLEMYSGETVEEKMINYIESIKEIKAKIY